MAENHDPFAPQESGPKVKFCKLKLYANRVTLETGASYSLSGVHDRDGNTREWRGKRLDKTNNRYHIVLQALATAKDGTEYEMTRDYLNNDKAYREVVHPALTAVFGTSDKFPVKTPAFVKLEEVPTGEKFTGRDGSEIERTAWRVTAKYATEAALKKAEADHFAQLSNNGASAEAEPVLKPGLVKILKAHAAEGVDALYDSYIDEATISKHGEAAIKAAIAEAIA